MFRIIFLLDKSGKMFLSEVMKFFLRMTGAKIGKNTYISFSSRIVGKLSVGDDVRILERVKIKASEITIGSGCIISADCFFSGTSKIKIADLSYLGKKARIDLSRDVTIGRDVGFGENSIIWTHGYFPPADEGYPVTYAPVIIGDGAWVSTNIIVLPGVAIGDHVIVGAGSVVTKSVEANKVIAGNPAKVLKDVQDIKHNKNFVTVISEIIDTYRVEQLLTVDKGEDFICYDFNSLIIYITDGNEKLIKKADKPSIILGKHVSNNYFKKAEGFFWFNFDDRSQKRSNNKFVGVFVFFFNRHGLGFF
jgi:acetyltransferase-like isoleucine patch superfamily enzyme